MALPVRLTKEGFTLLEAVIAILLLTVLMLWTMQSMLTAYSVASRNHLRDEAVRLAGETLTDIRNTPFSVIAASAASPTSASTSVDVDRQIQGSDYTFKVETELKSQTTLAYSAKITVRWSHKSTGYDYTVTTIVGDK